MNLSTIEYPVSSIFSSQAMWHLLYQLVGLRRSFARNQYILFKDGIPEITKEIPILMRPFVCSKGLSISSFSSRGPFQWHRRCGCGLSDHPHSTRRAVGGCSYRPPQPKFPRSASDAPIMSIGALRRPRKFRVFDRQSPGAAQ